MILVTANIYLNLTPMAKADDVVNLMGREILSLTILESFDFRVMGDVVSYHATYWAANPFEAIVTATRAGQATQCPFDFSTRTVKAS